MFTAGEFRLAREKSHGMGLHASTNRLRWMEEVEGLLAESHRG
jgi:hypothetical protein